MHAPRKTWPLVLRHRAAAVALIPSASTSREPLRRSLLFALCLLALSLPRARADAYEEALVNRNTTLNLIEALVKRGVLERKDADQMISEAREQAVRDAKAERAGEAAATADAGATGGAKEAVHVYYIPKQVREDLKRDVSAELEQRVAGEVKEQARKEEWGVPAALPAWVNRFSFTGDLRLRAEANLFADENQQFSYLNFPAINRAGGLTALQILSPQDAFLNTTTDRVRFRARLRLGINAIITDDLTTGIRLSTSNDRSPIGLNQTLGQTGQQYEVVLDRLFARYEINGANDYNWLTLLAGRHQNPWFSTETLFDRDLNFEGLAATTQLRLRKSSIKSRSAGSQLANWGSSQAGSLFLTVGAFPLQELEFAARDKYLFAAQTGIDWGFGRKSRLKVGLGYYDYSNIEARPNAFGRRDNDETAPLFFTKGNSLTRISNDVGESLANPRLVGLASDFNVLDLTAVYDWELDGPLHVIMTGSWSENIGFSRSEILARTGLDIEPRTHAWEARLDVGDPLIDRRSDWQAYAAYKYLERDSVLDAYTDSIFHLNGTDAKGWTLGANYGLARNTAMGLRWVSTEAIDGPPFGVDILLVDLNLAM
jgi:hypothetical protein